MFGVGGRRFCYALGCGDEYAALLRREGEWQIINGGVRPDKLQFRGKFLTLWDTWLTLCKVCCTLCRMDATLIAKPTNLVRKLRRWRELSQAELAERAHVSRQTIVNVEKGSYSPSVYLALAICRELGATVEEVFGDEQSMEVVKGETS